MYVVSGGSVCLCLFQNEFDGIHINGKKGLKMRRHFVSPLPNQVPPQKIIAFSRNFERVTQVEVKRRYFRRGCALLSGLAIIQSNSIATSGKWQQRTAIGNTVFIPQTYSIHSIYQNKYTKERIFFHWRGFLVTLLWNKEKNTNIKTYIQRHIIDTYTSYTHRYRKQA